MSATGTSAIGVPGDGGRQVATPMVGRPSSANGRPIGSPVAASALASSGASTSPSGVRATSTAATAGSSAMRSGSCPLPVTSPRPSRWAVASTDQSPIERQASRASQVSEANW